MENKVVFSGSMTAQINFAMQQNYVPVFRNMVMTNNTDEELKSVRLRISFEPEFAKTFESVPVDLAPSQPVEIAPVNIIMLADELFNLTEKLVGSVTIEALQGDEVIGQESRTIELLAYDQWSGINFMPETAAAFVTPNHPKVQEIISAAGVYMKKWCGDPAFTGYQTRNPNIVKQQMGAIYAALQERVSHGKSFDLSVVQDRVIDIPYVPDRQVVAHELRDKSLLILKDPPGVRIECAGSDITEAEHLLIGISLADQAAFPLYNIRRSPRDIQMVDGDQVLLYIYADPKL